MGTENAGVFFSFLRGMLALHTLGNPLFGIVTDTLQVCLNSRSRSGVKLILCALQERVRSIFEIARLDVIFRIVETRDEAVSL